MVRLTVGKIAKATGIGVEAVRYYEKRGLLPKPDRLPSGYRVYSDDTINRIHFIKRAKELGFSLEEIKELLELSEMPEADCADIRAKASEKIKEVEKRITDLVAIKESLSALSKFCPGKGKPLSKCSILKYFYGEDK